MTSEQTTVLVIKDQAGEYYLLPQATLEQGRVPAEHTAEVEQLIADQPDVQGHLGYVAHAAIHLGMTVLMGVGIIYGIQYAGSEEIQVPTIQFPPSQEPVRGPGGRPA